MLPKKNDGKSCVVTVVTFSFFQKVDEIKPFLPIFSIPEAQVDVVRDLSYLSGGLPDFKGNFKHVVFLSFSCSIKLG